MHATLELPAHRSVPLSSQTHSTRALRLTLVTETYPPEVNGVARTLSRWTRACRERGHRVQILRPRQFGELRSIEHVHGVPLPLYPQLRFGIAAPWRLQHLLMTHHTDIVHIATEGPLGMLSLLTARWLRIPIVSSFHTNFDHYFQHYGLSGLEDAGFSYLRWFHNRTAATLVPSESTRQRLEANGVQRVAIWSRGVDADVFNPCWRDQGFRESLGLGTDDLLLLCVGRLAPEKNLEALVHAVVRLRRERKQRRLVLALVGNGPLGQRLRSSRLRDLILPGEKHGRELSTWYASADVFAFPSLSETFGNVLLEAQASGLPVAGYDYQAVAERVTHGVDGWLVPREGDLTEALRHLCASAPLRRAYGEAARKKAELQDWEPIFDDLEERYQAMRKGRRAIAD